MADRASPSQSCSLVVAVLDLVLGVGAAGTDDAVLLLDLVGQVGVLRVALTVVVALIALVGSVLLLDRAREIGVLDIALIAGLLLISDRAVVIALIVRRT